MTRSRFLSVRLMLLGLVTLPHTAHAQTFISNNLNQNAATVAQGNALNGSQTKAYGFTTGASSNFFFTSTTIALSWGSGTTNTVSGGIYANNAGNPGALLVPFDTVSIPSGSGSTVHYRTLTPTITRYSLTPGTTYWVRFFNPTSTSVTQWDAVPSTQPTVTGEATSLIIPIGYKNSNNNGGAWGTSTLTNALTISLGIVPEPSTLALLALGVAGGAVARRRK